MSKILKWVSQKPADVVININSLPNNTTFARDAFPGFNNPSLTQTRTGAPQRELNRTDNNAWASVQSTAKWRDGGVRAMGRNFSMLTRYNPETGRGIGIEHSWDVAPGGSLTVYYSTGINPNANFVGGSTGTGFKYPLFSTNDCEGLFGPNGTLVHAGYVRYSLTGLFDIRAIGKDIFILFNNVLLASFPMKGFGAMDDGYALLGSNFPVGYGLIDRVEVYYEEKVPVISRMGLLDTDRMLYAPEVGWKNSKTTGTMLNGSTQITVASSAGFAIGDSVIIATGGEASGGARGFPAVGGYHNDDYFHAPSLPALLAITPTNEGKFGFIENPASPDHGRAVPSSHNAETAAWYGALDATFTAGTPGRVNIPRFDHEEGNPITFADMVTDVLPTGLTKGVDYFIKKIFNIGSVDAWFSISATRYGPALSFSDIGSGVHKMWENKSWYIDYKAPKALLTKISNILGTVWTLENPAKASTTNANVYFNNRSKCQVFDEPINGSGDYGQYVRFVIDGLDHAIWGRIFITQHGWGIEGKTSQFADGFIAPNGAPGGLCVFADVSNAVVRKLKLVGNHRLIGYGLDWSVNHYFTMLEETKVITVRSTNPIVADIDAFDIFLDCPGLSFCGQLDTSLTTPYGVKRVRIFQSCQDMHYMGWKIVDDECNLFSPQKESGGITYDDCEIHSPLISSGFETFQSLGSIFRNITTVNVKNSVNSAGRTSIINHNFLLEANVAGRSSVRDPMGWNLNTNQDNLQGGMILSVQNDPAGSTFSTDINNNGFVVGDLIVNQLFSGDIPVGLVPNQPYYVVNIISPNWKYQISLTPGGPPIVTSGPAGVIRVRRTTLLTFTNGSDIITVGNILSDAEGGALLVGSVVTFSSSGALPPQANSNIPVFITEKLSNLTFRVKLFPDDLATITFTNPFSGTHTIAKYVSDKVSQGVRIIGGKYIQQEWPDMGKLQAGWIQSVSHPRVLIQGSYPYGAGPPYIDGFNPTGYYKTVETTPGGPDQGNCVIRSGGPGLIVDGIRIGNATPKDPAGFAARILAEGGSLKIRNCVLPNGIESVTVGAGLPLVYEDSNMTTEEYLLFVAGVPAGAIGLWYADQANTSAVRQYIPNELLKASIPAPTWVNETPKPRTNWTLSSVVQTTGVLDSKGGHNGLRLVGTGSWSVRDDVFINFKAMQYTVVLIAKSNSGQLVQARLNFGSVAGGTLVNIHVGISRQVHTATKTAGLDNPFNLSSSFGSDVDITIERWFVYEGADPFPGSINPEQYGGHLLFGGTSAYTQLPTVAAKEVDINSASKLGQMLFDSFRNLTSFTAFATVNKVAATPNGINTIYAATSSNTYGDMDLSADYSNGTGFYFGAPAFGPIGYRQPFDPGVNTLFELLNKGYNVLVWKYDAVTHTGSFWVNDVLIAGDITTRTGIPDFQGLLFNFNNPRSSVKWNSGAFYPTALSRTNIEILVSTLRAKATANGLTLDTTSNFVYFEGDSNTIGAVGSAPGGQSWPYLYKPNAANPFYGADFSMNGGKLADMVARAPLVNGAVPTNKAGRKFILAGMIGTNDASVQYTSDAATYSANLLSYWAAAKAAGWTTIGIPILPRTDANVAASPPFETWRTTINNNLVAAVGNQLDACLNPASVPLLFATGASNNTTYFLPDKVHLTVGTGTTGQALLEAAIRPIINSFL